MPFAGLSRPLAPRAPRAPETIAALTALGAAAYVASGAWTRGFPVDDAWIHMVYGLELARHGALAYNEGVPATGATSPLWTCFAALAHFVVDPHARGPSVAAATALKVFGALAHAAASALAARCGRLASIRARVAPVAALVAGLLVATCPILAYAAVSGMEVSLAGALLLGALLAAAKGRPARAGVATGLAFLARPECAVIVPVVLALAAYRAPPPPWRRARHAGVAGAIASAFAAALFARNEIVSGRPLPATYYAKAAPVSGRVMIELRLERGFGDVLGALAPTSSRLFWALVLFAIAAAAGAAVLPRARGLPLRAVLVGGGAALAGVGYAALVSWMVRVQSPDVFYFQRYFAPAIPLLLVGATSGAATLVSLVALALRRLRARLRLRALALASVALGACAVVAETSGLPSMSPRYRRDVADIDEVDVAVGRFLERAAPEGSIIWSMNAGAIRYWGQRLVVDLGKLNTPDLFRAGGGDVLPSYDADFLVTLDGPVRVVTGPRTLERVFAARAPSLAPPPDAPAESQIVWRCRADLPENEEGVEIVGYPERRAGRCRAR